MVDTKVARAAVRFRSQSTLQWYRSSSWARRGFCSRCGCVLFYQRMEGEQAMPYLSIPVGSLDHSEALPLIGQIFTARSLPFFASLDKAVCSAHWGEEALSHALQTHGWHEDAETLTAKN